MSHSLTFAGAPAGRYAVRIVGPSGMETYLLPDGTEGPQDEAKSYGLALEAWEVGRRYRERFANQNFTYDVVNLDNPEEPVEGSCYDPDEVRPSDYFERFGL